MKIKAGYVLRQVADTYMAVPVGNEASKLRGVIALNETGFRIWKELERENTLESIVQRLSGEYEVSMETMRQNVQEFLDVLEEKGLLV